jgi:D-alanine-D-alanine ligase
MATGDRRFSFRDVVVIADIFDRSASNDAFHRRRDLEMTDSDTLGALIKAIGGLGLRVHHYRNPAALARNAWRHKRDLVLAIYGGQRSRNRMALVPAICESFGLKFVGPDVYGRIVAQDKEVSKRLAKDCGLRTPAWRVVRDEDGVRHAAALTLPIVVKPLLEGSSIGISQESRVTNLDKLAEFIRDLIRTCDQPVLVEEFVPGREVAYARIQKAGDAAWAFSEIVIASDPSYFENRLFDADEKQERTADRAVRNIDAELSSDDRQSINSFLDAFGTYGYCRVEGRLADGKFWFIEMTPDAWIAPTGQFAMGYIEKGWSYEAVIEAVLASAN